MRKLLMLLTAFIILYSNTHAQVNLYQSNGVSRFVGWPMFESATSLFYLTFKDDTVRGFHTPQYFVSAVNKATHTLQRSIRIFADTPFNQFQYQSFPISYSLHPATKKLNFFIKLDEDSSLTAPSILKSFPKSIWFLQMDTLLNVTVPRKKIFQEDGNDRYDLSNVNLSVPQGSNNTVLSYDVRDTFITDLVVSTATKLLVVNDTGLLLDNKFVGWEPTGTDSYFPSHFTTGDIYDYYNGGHVVNGQFDDSLGVGRYLLLYELDSNFDLVDTFDNFFEESIVNQPPGRHIGGFGSMRETKIFLPGEQMIYAAPGWFSDSLNRSNEFYFVGKGSRKVRYKPTDFYIPPHTDSSDFAHNATLNFFPAVHNQFDNRIYLYSSTHSAVSLEFCTDNQSNLGQIACMDTALQEKWVKYIYARPGHCIRSYCMAPAKYRAGVYVSGHEYSLADPDDQTQWHAFIYHVDSLSKLGVDNPESPIFISDQFSVFPNPATTQLNIRNLPGTSFVYSIVNSLGQTVVAGNKGQGLNTQVDVSAFSPGIYMLSVRANDQKVFHFKFVKE